MGVAGRKCVQALVAAETALGRRGAARRGRVLCRIGLLHDEESRQLDDRNRSEQDVGRFAMPDRKRSLHAGGIGSEFWLRIASASGDWADGAIGPRIHASLLSNKDIRIQVYGTPKETWRGRGLA